MLALVLTIANHIHSRGRHACYAHMHDDVRVHLFLAPILRMRMHIYASASLSMCALLLPLPSPLLSRCSAVQCSAVPSLCLLPPLELCLASHAQLHCTALHCTALH